MRGRRSAARPEWPRLLVLDEAIEVSGRRRALDPHTFRRLSLFQLGIRWLRHLLALAENPILPPYLPYLHPS